MSDLLQRLRERKLVQWALAYIAAAFALIQVLDVIGQQFGWPDAARRGVTLALGVGFLVMLVLAWYHGERGAQKASNGEILIVALLLVIGGGLVWRMAPRNAGAPPVPDTSAARTAMPAVVAERKSIAVLPFANLSADKDNDYFANGIRDMILTKLASIGDLKVISRTSTDRYGVHPEDIRTVALQLGVASVLEGSVQKSGNQVLINLQLIDASNDHHLWAEAYKRTVDDIFGVEGEIAQIVAEGLHAKLSEAEQKVVAEKPTTNPQAFDSFLRAEQASYEARKSESRPGLAAAIKLYESAVAQDPQFALAWAELASTQAWLYWYGGVEGTAIDALAESARNNADRALALQPGLSEANLAMGFYHYYVRVDLPLALVSFESSLRAKPNDAKALHALGLITRRLNRLDEAIERLRAATRIDPANDLAVNALRTTLIMTRHYSEAARICERQLALAPDAVDAMTTGAVLKIFLHDDIAAAIAYLHGSEPEVQFARADFLRAQGKLEEAIAVILAMPEKLDDSAEYSQTRTSTLGGLYLDSGRLDLGRPLLLDARKTLRAASAHLPENHPSAANTQLRLAYIEASLGEHAAALERVRTALELPMSQADKNHLGWVESTGAAARVYARAKRPDLAVPLLKTLLDEPGTGFEVAYARLRIDPDFAPIRSDPGFQSLLAAHQGSGDIGS